MISYWLLKPLLFLLTHSPRGLLQGIGKILAFIVWHVSKERRHVAIKNAEILGAKDPVKTARKSFDYTFMAYLEMFYAPNIDKKFVEKYVTLEGYELYENLRKEREDIVFIGGHFGIWSMIATVVHQKTGLKFITVGRSTKNKAFDKILDELRTFEGVKYVTHRGAMEKVSAYFAEGYHPGVYIDHIAQPKDCINADFCGYKVPVIAGIPALCARKNYPILFFFGLYEGNKKIKIIMDGPVFPDKSLNPKDRILKLAEDINKIYEKIYRKYPEQWYLIHRRFKRIEMPDGSIYHDIYKEGTADE